MAEGSSPHTRGLPWVSTAYRRYWRIIPAYAGPTVNDLGRVITLQDHPRIRGAYLR